MGFSFLTVVTYWVTRLISPVTRLTHSVPQRSGGNGLTRVLYSVDHDGAYVVKSTRYLTTLFWYVWISFRD